MIATLPGRPASGRPEGRPGFWLLLAIVLVLAALPVGRLLLQALAGDALAPLLAPASLRAAWHSIESGVLSGLLALVLGTGMALLLGVTDLPQRHPIGILFVLSMLMAPQVTALAFTVLAGPASPLLNALGMAPAAGTPNPLIGRGGVILVLGLHHAPLVTILVLAGLKTVPHELVEAAAMDGAGQRTLLARIVLPLLAPQLVAAALLAFVAAFGNFGIPALLGMPAGYLTLPTLIYRELVGNGLGVIDRAALLAVAMLVLVLLPAGGAAVVLARSGTRRSTERPLGRFWRLGRWRLPGLVLAWAMVALVLFLPLGALLASALAPTYGARLTPASATLAHFAEVLWRQDVTVRAFRNSFLFAGGAALLLALVVVPVGHALDRAPARARQLLLPLIELPYALPGIVLAIACILLFVRPLPLLGVTIYATPWIILFAYMARFLPVVLKPPLAALAQLERAQEEAAALDGAGPLARLVHVVLPAIWPAVTAGGLLAFLLAFNELTVSALLWTAGTETLGVVLFSLEEAGLVSEASAVALSATAVVVLLVVAIDRLGDRLPAGTLPWRL
ncbi:MAG TPA: iron ABC transporter permease [Geminicoccus sp.]|uniref:ABC transporter permease n=1 Tax=Geminicoccus sp. TaxID=2024832 RepID=UPI002C56F3C8|nr:iron ABC transporter permease [Geminicoccus sp.]HWL67018.1 iron ABC transporter permease [Geminicoccus sp.]